MQNETLSQSITLLFVGMLVVIAFMGIMIVIIHYFIKIANKFASDGK